MKNVVVDIGSLSPRKRELFARALEAKEKKATTADTIPHQPGCGPFPLSFAQERLWFIDQLQPGKAAYNIPQVIRLTGELKIEALERAINEITRRHDALRTMFKEEEGKPVQVIREHRPQFLPVVDLTALPEKARDCAARMLAEEESAAPFNLSSGRLLRMTLLRLGRQQHLGLLTTHHIASDGWSKGVFNRELGILYGAFVQGRLSPLPELAIQYADYSIWQRDWLRGEILKTQMDYWKRQLSSIKLLELPTDRPRPHVQTFNGAVQDLRIGLENTRAIKELGRQNGVTLFMLLLAGFQVLLSRSTGQQDIVVGSPIANRTRGDTENLIGFFVNTLVMRLDLSGDPNVIELLQRVKETCLGAYAHQDLPFEKLVDELQPERSTNLNPLVQALFAVQNAPNDGLKMEGIEWQVVGGTEVSTRFDMEVHMWECPQGVTGSIIYNADIFKRETIARMAAQLERLYSEMANQPQAYLSDLEMLSEGERRQILEEWNDTACEYPRGSCIHEIFSEQAERIPDAPAVIYLRERLTYRELDNKSNQVASRLKELGVGPDVPVGICVERSLDFVIWLLGILKAGGCYLPMDPAYPRERLSFMLEDARANILVTQEKLLGSFSGYEGAILCLDKKYEWDGPEQKGGRAAKSNAKNLAYIIYTSGSTGLPKGVAVPHCAVNRLVLNTNYIQLSKADRVAQISNVSFDAATFEIWGALLNGAVLIGVTRDEALSPLDFARELREQNISAMFLTAALFNQLAAEVPDAFATVRTVMFGGEAGDPKSIAKVLKNKPPRRLVNGYGPTENTTFSACYEVTTMADDAATVSIGRPISNSQCYILDLHFNPVPVGVGGEIFAAGEGLARGYLNRGSLTAEKFLPNPFSRVHGQRMYRTGDIGKYRADGNIEYLGRQDDQIKLRGHRIELGEIESVLGRHPSIGQNAVVLRDHHSGRKKLVAFATLSPNENGGMIAEKSEKIVPHLLRHLREKLPDYMVPSAIVLLEKLPLTVNGKVDRKALPNPDWGRTDLPEDCGAPHNAIEEKLVVIWREVLGIEKVQVNDNFFELGGDSILSIQIVSRANSAGIKLTPRQLFEHQTIVELAQVVEDGGLKPANQEIVSGTVELTPIQHWFFERNLANAHHFNQAVMLMTASGVDAEVVESAWEHVTMLHDGLRMRYEHIGGQWRQTNAERENNVTFARIDLRGITELVQAEQLSKEVNQLQQSLNLQNGPLVRVGWFDMGDGLPARLLIVVHHLVVDGVSWRVLLEDLQKFCAHLKEGKKLGLGSRTSSYQQWAKRLKESAQDAALEKELEYWEGIGWEAIPVDWVRGENFVSSADKVLSGLGGEETQALLQEVPQKYHSQINDVLLAALTRAFEKWSGRCQMWINLEGHGREDLFEDLDITRTVGWFTTIYPVKLGIQAGMTPSEALMSVKEQLRRVPKSGIGYGLLKYLNERGRERLRPLPTVEMAFNYLGQFDNIFESTAMFQVAKESAGPGFSGRGNRAHLVEIECWISGGHLATSITYSRNFHSRFSIEKLSSEFLNCLKELIGHCRHDRLGGYTPSDFPLAHLGQEELNALSVEKPDLEDIYPLSPIQEGMLFHTLYASNEGNYVIQFSYRLQGRTHFDAFKASFKIVVNEYPVLRSSFIWIGRQKPLQIVRRDVTLTWVEEDWSSLGADEQERKLNEYLKRDRRNGFDMTYAPLMRFSLFRLSDSAYRFVWSFHHILLDGWSIPLLFEEILRCYDDLAAGREVRVRHCRPYREYIAWLAKQDLSRAERYWRQRLAGFCEPNSFRRYWRISNKEGERGQKAKTLSPELTKQLQQLCRDEQLTLNTLLQGAWALLVGRYSQRTDVVFGATMSGRPAGLKGVEKMVGIFLNTLPVRVNLLSELEVVDWLKQVQSEQLEMRSYEYSPLTQVQGWSELPGAQPLFESTLAFENYPTGERPSGGLRADDLRVTTQTNYLLTVLVHPGTALHLEINYNAGRLDEGTVGGMVDYIEQLLRQIIEKPRSRLSALEGVAEAERNQMIDDFNSDLASI